MFSTCQLAKAASGMGSAVRSLSMSAGMYPESPDGRGASAPAQEVEHVLQFAPVWNVRTAAESAGCRELA